MHDSNKLWMWAAVFLVVLGLLAGIFFSATPEKMTPVIEKRKALMEKRKEARQARNAPSRDRDEAQAQSVVEKGDVSAE
ncbi:MAG: hypothetical protein LBO62_01550 [Endomicrobium sp.]|jgi:hypothetical protein|nr:hypothetical protein [Endomicrobium sp.]